MDMHIILQTTESLTRCFGSSRFKIVFACFWHMKHIVHSYAYLLCKLLTARATSNMIACSARHSQSERTHRVCPHSLQKLASCSTVSKAGYSHLKIPLAFMRVLHRQPSIRCVLSGRIALRTELIATAGRKMKPAHLGSGFAVAAMSAVAPPEYRRARRPYNTGNHRYTSVDQTVGRASADPMIWRCPKYVWAAKRSSPILNYQHHVWKMPLIGVCPQLKDQSKT